MAARKKSNSEQMLLAFGPARNSDLFSNHWLESRLPLEPEWDELKDQAKEALDRILDVWAAEKGRVRFIRLTAHWTSSSPW